MKNRGLHCVSEFSFSESVHEELVVKVDDRPPSPEPTNRRLWELPHGSVVLSVSVS